MLCLIFRNNIFGWNGEILRTMHWIVWSVRRLFNTSCCHSTSRLASRGVSGLCSHSTIRTPIAHLRNNETTALYTQCAESTHVTWVSTAAIVKICIYVGRLSPTLSLVFKELAFFSSTCVWTALIWVECAARWRRGTSIASTPRLWDRRDSCPGCRQPTGFGVKFATFITGQDR